MAVVVDRRPEVRVDEGMIDFSVGDESCVCMPRV